MTKNETVVLITGGGRGIGRATGKRFAAAGARVVVAARSEGDLNETKSAIEAEGGSCEMFAADVSSASGVAALVEFTKKAFGRIDVLVNNAGVAPLAMIEELDEEVFDQIVAVNIKATYLCSRAVWPIMKKARGGTIISISSLASVDPFPGFAAYGASKTWINAWTKALAEEGRENGISVFAVAPGAVETGMLRGAFPTFPEDKALAPEDVAEQIFTLTQPACRFATGQTVFVRK